MLRRRYLKVISHRIAWRREKALESCHYLMQSRASDFVNACVVHACSSHIALLSMPVAATFSMSAAATWDSACQYYWLSESLGSESDSAVFFAAMYFGLEQLFFRWPGCPQLKHRRSLFNSSFTLTAEVEEGVGQTIEKIGTLDVVRLDQVVLHCQKWGKSSIEAADDDEFASKLRI